MVIIKYIGQMYGKIGEARANGLNQTTNLVEI